mmetsp:Transcript_2052/g.5203  ORF Transcript_2052/g.5203 Transcript_2052/m.5203 type:complete len:731 (+) Transcript_2052:167-2359(+)
MAVDTAAAFHIPSSCMEDLTGAACMDVCESPIDAWESWAASQPGLYGDVLEVLVHLRFEIIFALCGFLFAMMTRMLRVRPPRARAPKYVQPQLPAAVPRKGEDQQAGKRKTPSPLQMHRVPSSRASTKSSSSGKASWSPSEWTSSSSPGSWSPATWSAPPTPNSFHMASTPSNKCKASPLDSAAIERQRAQTILSACCKDKGRPLKLYREALENGMDFSTLLPVELHQLHLALVLAALRTDAEVNTVVPLLQDLQRHHLGISPGLMTLVAKKFVQRRQFAQCLAAHDAVKAPSRQRQEVNPGIGTVEDRDYWSCLLQSATETGQYHRCAIFWEALRAVASPWPQDYMCMIRAAALRRDWRSALHLLKELAATGCLPDGAMINCVVSTCVDAKQFQAARRVLDISDSHGRFSVDILAYNTLMKGYAFADAVDEMFELIESMKQRGVAATQVTYGILLDTCVTRGDLERAAIVFQEMISGGCKMNTVLYTTLIKGFAKADRIQKAMEVYQHMRSQGGIKPDTITFSVLIKAHSDAGMMKGAVELLETMLEYTCRPDEIIFNNLIMGCIKDTDVVLARKFLSDMIALGVRPSNATASILIKLYAKCNLLEDAHKFLKTMRSELRVTPEPRVWTQLLHACVRERQGRRAVEVFESMAERSCVDTTVTSKILSTCVNFNMYDTAAALLQVAQQAGCTVSQETVKAVNPGAGTPSNKRVMNAGRCPRKAFQGRVSA